MKKAERNLNIYIKCKGLTVKEKEEILKEVRNLGRKRHSKGMPRLMYKIVFDESEKQTSNQETEPKRIYLPM